MKIPPQPEDEDARLASLRLLELLDTPAEERFDRITRLARKTCSTPIALITLLDEERQWFKSAQGLLENETARAVSFCGHAILDDKVLLVEDATADSRFSDNPLVVDPPSIRMYAGTPIKSPDGKRVGTLCVIDRSPRSLTTDELSALEDLGALVETTLKVDVLGETEQMLRAQLSEAERKALIDPLTRLWNREMMDRVLKNEIERSRRNALPLSVMMVDLDHFKRVNDQLGHLAGDMVLREAAMLIRRSLRDYDTAGRFGGEEFVAVLPECDTAQAGVIAERVLSELRATPITTDDGSTHVTASVGTCSLQQLESITPEAMIAAADRAMYLAKNAGRDCHRAQDHAAP